MEASCVFGRNLQRPWMEEKEMMVSASPLRLEGLVCTFLLEPIQFTHSENAVSRHWIRQVLCVCWAKKVEG